MRARPLGFLCLLIILLQSIFLMFGGGGKIQSPPTKHVVLEGQVYQKSKTSEIQILYLKNNSINYSKLMIYNDNPVAVGIGQTICIRGELSAFERARNPGNFDQAVYYARQGIEGKVWCEKVLKISGETNWFAEKLYEVKQNWKQMLSKHMGEKEGAVLSAMILGEKGEMDERIKELYQKSGIGHLLAISGLHISFIGLGIYKMLRKGGAPFWLAGILAMGILGIYGAMIGFSVSVFRAYIMFMFRIGAEITGRVYDMLTALLFAAALTVLGEPTYLTDAGFWMSYGAILGILFVLPKLQKSFGSYGKLMSALWSSMAVNIMLFPVLLWFYYEFPVYSIGMNLVAIPLMSILLGCGLLGSVFCWIGPIGNMFFFVCQKVLVFYEWLGNVSSRLPFARIVFGRPEMWKVVCYYLVLVFVLLLVSVAKRRPYLWWSVVGIFIFLMGVRFPKGVAVTMLDVGQGDCIYVQGEKGQNYLIDGGSSDVKEVAKYRIEPFLKSQGVGSLDYVFLTHGDGDHCNGIQELMERQRFGVRIHHLVIPIHWEQDDTLVEIVKMAREQGIAVLTIETGQSVQEGEMKLICLQPNIKDELEGNAGSLVMELKYNHFEMLFTGDVENDGEERLTKSIAAKTYDVLKVSHHGSKNATKEAFLGKVRPRIALISAGVDNVYQHPHPDVLGRLERIGCEIFETAKKGAITIRSDGNLLTISLLPYRL